MTEVTDKICKAFGVKHWSELVINGYKLVESGDITEMASTVFAEKRSLLDCGSTAVPSDQGQAVYDNSAVMGTEDEPNSLVDGGTQNCVLYYDDLTKIHVKFVEQQICRDPADFHRYRIFICKFVRSQLQEIKSQYEKSWEMIKRFNPDVKIEDFKKEFGMSGNPNNHLLQEVFNLFKNEEKDGLTLLQHAYDSQNADTTAQEEEHGQRFLDAVRVCFYPFYSMQGLGSNGMLSEQQYCEMAAEWTGQHADTNSMYVSAGGDTAVIQVNAAADVVMVRCCLEDGKVSGIGAVLHTA